MLSLARARARLALQQPSLSPSLRRSLPPSLRTRPPAFGSRTITTGSIERDDASVRLLFDSPSFWSDFAGGLRPATGLFQNAHLTSPAGFTTFSATALRQCSAIVQRIEAAKTPEEYSAVVRLMDRLSDLLCRVIDQAEFVRASHPDGRFRAAADDAHDRMFAYMNELNTATGLHAQLARGAETAGWVGEEAAAAGVLLRDFAHSAITLPARERARFVRLSSEISRVGAEFTDEMAPRDDYVRVHGNRLAVASEAAARAARSSDDEDVRRVIYTARRQSSPSSVRRLERLLNLRSELASLVGFDSYGHLALADKMAGSPEAVDRFLTALVDANRPRVRDELAVLAQLKAADGGGPLAAWDIGYYHRRHAAVLRRGLDTNTDFLSAFFSVGTVMQGISRLFWRLFGLRFVPVAPGAGETWHPDVRRLDVLDESGKPVGVVYCDLFARVGKAANPAHFTLRCSREITPSELTELAAIAEDGDGAKMATDGMAHTVNGDRINQLPTIALVCDFPKPGGSISGSPSLLSLRDVRTLFHELGHAAHSLLGRTALQNVAGTRCAVDFAELPSVLFERFAADPSALALWARHYSTDAPLPADLLAQRLALERTTAATETESHILLALLDQALHASPTPDSTQAFHSIAARHGTIPEPAGTSNHGFFGHLVGYGATYYAYLFDRAIAARVWGHLFEPGAGGKEGRSVSRESGEKLAQEVLRWGGARSGWECVAGVLDRPELAAGGEKAMEEVGRWGIADI